MSRSALTDARPESPGAAQPTTAAHDTPTVEPMPQRSGGKLWLRILWYAFLLFLIFLLHDLPDREFRYWRM